MKLSSYKTLIALLAVAMAPWLYGNAQAGTLEELENGKEYGENVLRPGQIKACMLFDKRLDAQKSGIKALLGKLDRTENELYSLKTIVKSGLSSNSSRAAVAQYDRNSKKFTETKITFREDAAKYKNLLQDYNEDIDRYNSQCKNKERYEEDYKAVLKMMK